MKTIRQITLATAISATLLGAGGVMAFEDGDLDTQSTGNFDVRLLVDQQAKIWGFEDLVLTDATANTEASQSICVASNSGRYSLQLTSTNSLNLTGAGLTDIDYKVQATADAVGSGNTTSSETHEWVGSSPTDPTFDFVTSNTDATDASICGDGDNPRNLTVKAIIVNTDTVTDAGTYTDTVTLTVAAR